jgi:hypothetical protein
VTLIVLYLLALTDGLLCGLRTAMGRCPLIRKREYYRKAAVRGVAAAQIVSVAALAALLVAVAVSSHREMLRDDLEAAAGRMLWVFVPYAALVLFNLALRMVPSTDIRTATSVFMLGPLTWIRPHVMIAGVAYGIAGSRLWETRVLGIFILALMLLLEFALDLRAARAQRIQIRELVG